MSATGAYPTVGEIIDAAAQHFAETEISPLTDDELKRYIEAEKYIDEIYPSLDFQDDVFDVVDDPEPQQKQQQFPNTIHTHVNIENQDHHVKAHTDEKQQQQKQQQCPNTIHTHVNIENPDHHVNAHTDEKTKNNPVKKHADVSTLHK